MARVENATRTGADASQLDGNQGLDRLLDDLLVFPIADGGAEFCELMVGIAEETSTRRVQLAGNPLVEIDGLIVGVLGMNGPGLSVRDVRVLLDRADALEPCEVAEALDGATCPGDSPEEVVESLARTLVERCGARGAVAIIQQSDGMMAGSAGSLEGLAAAALGLSDRTQIRIVWDGSASAVA